MTASHDSASLPGAAPTPDPSATEGTAAPETHDTAPERPAAPASATAAEPAPASTIAAEPAPEPTAATPAEPARSAPAASTPAEEDFAALFAASEAEHPAQARAKMGDTVQGHVIAVGPENAFVAIGAKAEAVISLAEFRDPTTGEISLAIGDTLTATITDDGSRSGSIILKRTLGRGGRVPGELEEAREHGLAIEGVVTGQNKGGFDVQVAGVRAFCPASQIDLRRADPAQYIGQRLSFRVTQISAGGRNVVVARRPLLEEEAAAQAASTWERLQVGATVRGTITSLRDFGAFVDLGGVEGLIHVSELGYGRAQRPADVVQVGQEVEAQIVKLQPAGPDGRGRISLSLRALATDPWTTAAERFPVGTATRGTVRRLEAFGAFVELAPGVDGLVHVSRMSLTGRVAHPRNVVQVGQEVDVTVVGVELDKRRIGLSMVESERREREQLEAEQKREQRETIATKLGEARGLGTLGELIAKSAKKPKP
jgi:small subunit ribosomal protein S1